MKRQVQFQVVGEAPTAAVIPLFSNFVGISHVGTEVQFEFIFLDLNQVAQHAARYEENPTATGELAVFNGKTVAKIVMPSWVVAQMKDHFLTICNKIEVSGGSQEASQERKDGS